MCRPKIPKFRLQTQVEGEKWREIFNVAPSQEIRTKEKTEGKKLECIWSLSSLLNFGIDSILTIAYSFDYDFELIGIFEVESIEKN